MSIHKSLFIGGALQKQRSVLTRRERLERLEREGRWSDSESVFGLPKVRTKYKVLTRKQLKAQAAAASAEATTAEGEAEAEGEAKDQSGDESARG